MVKTSNKANLHDPCPKILALIGSAKTFTYPLGFCLFRIGERRGQERRGGEERSGGEERKGVEGRRQEERRRRRGGEGRGGEDGEERRGQEQEMTGEERRWKGEVKADLPSSGCSHGSRKTKSQARVTFLCLLLLDTVKKAAHYLTFTGLGNDPTYTPYSIYLRGTKGLGPIKTQNTPRTPSPKPSSLNSEPLQSLTNNPEPLNPRPLNLAHLTT